MCLNKLNVIYTMTNFVKNLIQKNTNRLLMIGFLLSYLLLTLGSTGACITSTGYTYPCPL